MKNQAEHLNRAKIEQALMHFYRSSLPVFPVLPVVCFPFTCSF